mgnify:CR=1 FL=1
MMKASTVVATLLLGMLLTSCASQSVYLQDISVAGPQVQPPLFITKENKQGDFRVVPRLQINDRTTLVGRASGHSNVSARGIYEVEAVTVNGVITYIERKGVNTKTFEGRNFTWAPTRFNASLNFEYVAARNFSLVGGANYSSGTSQSFLGANAGVGFFFEDKNIAARVDIGAHWSAVTYDVSYVITTTPFSFSSPETQVAFFREKGKGSYWNAYGAFTINAKVTEWPVQLFTQLAINRQTVVNLDRKADFTIDKSVVLESVSYFLVTPGVYFDLSPKSRVLVGVQLRDETALLEAEPGVLVSPFVQFEFGL